MKQFFWENKVGLETLGKFSLHVGVSYKIVLNVGTRIKNVKIGSTNTKPFFWGSETNLEISRKLSPYIGPSYKFNLKFVKSLNSSSELWNIDSRLYNANFGQ